MRITASFRHILTAILFFASVVPVFAADYTVSPLARNYDLERRDIINGLITINNPTDRQVRLYAGVNEVATDGDGIIESFTPPSMTNRKIDPTSWVQITRGRLEVPAGEKLEVPFTIKVHPQTEPGKYSVFIGFAKASNQPQAMQMIRAGDGKGTLINIGIAQQNNQFLRLESFSVDRFMTGGEAEVTFELHNPSRAPVAPSGEVIFYNSRGIEVASLPINADGASVEEARTESFALSVPPELSLGKYKAFLSVEYGDDMRAAVTDSEFFYVAPIMQLVLIFLGLMVLVTATTLLVYRRYDTVGDEDMDAVPMYIRDTRSSETDHDVDLSKRHDANP